MDSSGLWSEGGIGMEEKKENKAKALECPRCNSWATKFCYYNNYNLSQPRYFCKTCRRYWTAGGTLRNVPVGGASRKTTKQHRSSSSNQHLMGFFKTTTDYATRFMPSNTITTTSSLNNHDHQHQHNHNNNGNFRADDDNPSTTATLFFPFEDLKPATTSSQTDDQLQLPPDSNAAFNWTNGGDSW